MKKYALLVTVLFISILSTNAVKAQGVADINTQLCHNWTISSLVVDGAEIPAPALNMSDKLTIGADNSIDMIINGVGFAGTWSVNNTGVWMTIVLSESTAMRLKIMEITDTKLKVDYVGDDNLHTILVFGHL